MKNRENKAYTFRFSARAPVSGGHIVAAQMRGAELYYNDMIAIERRRRAAITRHWAEVGGYVDRLEALAAAREAARKIPGKAERKLAWRAVDAEQKALHELERATMAANTTDPATQRRKQRAKDLREAAKAAGDKLTPEDIARILDADPGCITERDRVRLRMVAEAEARGKKMSPRSLNAEYKRLGLIRDTDYIDDAAKAEDLAAYRRRGITHGTRAVVAEAVQRAIADRMPDVPHFARPDTKPVTIGVSYVVADGMTVAKLFGCQDTRAQIMRLPDPPGMTAGSRRSGRRALLRIRVGSDERAPVWAEVPILLDRRDMPMEARVSTVRVSRERLGDDVRWSAHVCVVAGSSIVPRRPPQTDAAVAVDLGWRRMESGAIRVATWVAEDGECGHIECPVSVIGRVEKTNEIKGLLSDLLEKVTKELAAWDIPDAHDSGDPVVEHLARCLRGVARCRSGVKLARLAQWWESEPIRAAPGVPAHLSGSREYLQTPEAMRHYRVIAEWHERYRHLTQWAANGDEGARDARDDMYRVAVSRLVSRYGTIIVRGHSIAEMKRRKLSHETDHLVEVDDRRRAQMFFGAPGYFRSLLLGMAESRGRLAVAVEHPRLPVRCHACGHDHEWDREHELRTTCGTCGATWDQDLNTAQNLIDLHRERFGGGEYTVGVRADAKSRKGKEKCESPRLSRQRNARAVAEMP